MASVCCHGIPLFHVSLWTPGEQQFYAFALLSMLLEHLPNSWKVGCHYDIGCQIHHAIHKWDFALEWRECLSWGVSIFHAYSVGRITVCYGTCLQSPVLWVRSYHQDCIIFGFSFYIQNLAKILVELEIWIFKSDPSLIVDVFLNQDYSGNSNGGICVIIPALGDENRDLPCF